MYLQVDISCKEEVQELLIAELFELDFDSFAQTDNEVSAYIERAKYDEEKLTEVLNKYLGACQGKFEVSLLEEKNWNEEWEKNFDPVIVEDQIAVKASFHKIDGKFPFQILVNPKMSFGTGHHETTYLMLQSQLRINHTGKKVMDAGTGTGILAIMAAMLGASSVLATDIDDWSIENSQENVALNGYSHCIDIRKGTVNELALNDKFDIVLANINRNVLLHEIPVYESLLAENGKLLLSGFYDTDIQPITVACERHHLRFKDCHLRNNWACLLFHK